MAQSISVEDSLKNVEWVAANYTFLRNCFSEEFEAADSNFILRFGWKLKLHGVEWREVDDISNFLGKFHNSKIFDSIIDVRKMKAQIRRHRPLDGSEPAFVYPREKKPAVQVKPPVVSAVPPQKDDGVIDVVAKERHVSAATKLIEQVRSWAK